MIIFDVILLIILACFICYGLFFGLISAFGSLVAVVTGIFLASRYYADVYMMFKNLFFGHNIAGNIISFFVLFIIANRLICLIFAFINRAFEIISIIPFLKTINRLGGAVLGFLEGGFILGLVLFVVSQSTYGSWFLNLGGHSVITPYLIKFINVFAVSFPEIMKKLQNLT